MTIYDQALARLKQGDFTPQDLFAIRDALEMLDDYGFENINVQDLLREAKRDIRELQVEIYKYEKLPGETRFVKVKEAEGMFIEYGLDTIEGDNGYSSFSTGIVEMADGTVRNVPVEMLKFIDL